MSSKVDRSAPAAAALEPAAPFTHGATASTAPLDTTQGSGAPRHTAYAASLARLIRYLAYTSDVGEAFRPIVHVYVVRSAYAISWGYVIGDVAWEGYKDYKHGVTGSELYKSITERAVFQSVASMIFPAITIHETVRLTKKFVFPKIQNGKFMKWGPTFCGLGVIPFLPFMYDYPVEVACEKVFDFCWKIENPKKHRHHHDAPH